MTLAEIRPYQDRTVILHLADGEITTATIVFVDAEYEDITVDVISTNRQDNYRHAGAAYAIAFVDLVSVQEISK
jgi:predicted membrane GTPase involved in stress response